VERLIGEEIHRISGSAASELAVARGNEKALASELRRLSDRSQSTDSSLIELRELERDAEASRKLYEAFLTRAKQTAEEERMETAAARVLAPAELPIGASYPPRTLLLVMALVVGLGLGATIALLCDHLDDTVRSASQLRELTGLSVFVAGPQHEKVALTRWLRIDRPRGPQPQPQTRSDDYATASAGAAIAVRALRHGLLDGDERAEPRSVMVVSTRDGEGTAKFAISLALASSVGGKRVLIIDADTERRALTQLVAPDAQTGIFDVIGAGMSLASVAVANAVTGLNFLPMPATTQTSARSISREQLAVIFAAAQVDFDCIIICGAPLLAEPGTGNLCQSVDQIVLVTRAGLSRRDEVEDALQLLRMHHCKPHSAVLTVEVDSETT
jgi:Mrp family chromosome partitioning ATPase